MPLKQHLPNSFIIEVSCLNSLSYRFVLNPSRDLWKIKPVLSIPGKKYLHWFNFLHLPFHLLNGKLRCQWLWKKDMKRHDGVSHPHLQCCLWIRDQVKVSSPVKPSKNVISNHRNSEKNDQLERWEEHLVWATLGHFVI